MLQVGNLLVDRGEVEEYENFITRDFVISSSQDLSGRRQFVRQVGGCEVFELATKRQQPASLKRSVLKYLQQSRLETNHIFFETARRPRIYFWAQSM